MTARYRHLMEDIRKLIPHHKKESKVSHYQNFFFVFFFLQLHGIVYLYVKIIGLFIFICKYLNFF